MAYASSLVVDAEHASRHLREQPAATGLQQSARRAPGNSGAVTIAVLERASVAYRITFELFHGGGAYA